MKKSELLFKRLSEMVSKGYDFEAIVILQTPEWNKKQTEEHLSKVLEGCKISSIQGFNSIKGLGSSKNKKDCFITFDFKEFLKEGNLLEEELTRVLVNAYEPYKDTETEEDTPGILFYLKDNRYKDIFPVFGCGEEETFAEVQNFIKENISTSINIYKDEIIQMYEQEKLAKSLSKDMADGKLTLEESVSRARKIMDRNEQREKKICDTIFSLDFNLKGNKDEIELLLKDAFSNKKLNSKDYLQFKAEENKGSVQFKIPYSGVIKEEQTLFLFCLKKALKSILKTKEKISFRYMGENSRIFREGTFDYKFDTLGEFLNNFRLGKEIEKETDTIVRDFLNTGCMNVDDCDYCEVCSGCKTCGSCTC